MPIPELSPYEILELTPSAQLPDILKAYQNAVRRRQYPPATINQAFADLKNPRKRAEHDLQTVSGFGDSAQLEPLMAALPPLHVLPDQVEPLTLMPALALGALGTIEQAFGPLPPSPLRAAIPEQLGALTAELPMISIPS